MPRPNPDYTISLVNHQTGDRMKLDLIDLPFPSRRFHKSATAARASYYEPGLNFENAKFGTRSGAAVAHLSP